MSEQTFLYLNKAVPRTEDYRLLTGYGRYLDDIEIAGALHVCFVRSPHAHARIVSVDTAAAGGMPGVVTVVTGRELAQWTMPMRVAAPVEGLLPVEFATMPTDIVRFQGDLVACVVATDRYLAEDAAEQVMVEFEPLPVVTDMWQALEADAAQVDPGVPGNLVSHQTYSNGDPQSVSRRAYRVVETTFSQQRQTHVPIETRGCAAVWDSGREHLTFHIGTQVPHPLRTQLARRLRLSESEVTVISPDVGGAFGQKIALSREELTVAALARASQAAGALARRPDGESDRGGQFARETSAAHAPRWMSTARCSRSIWRSAKTSARIASFRRTTRARRRDDVERTVPAAALRVRREGRAEPQMRQCTDARADVDHQLGHGRHDRSDCARTEAGSGRRAPPQPVDAGGAAVPYGRPANCWPTSRRRRPLRRCWRPSTTTRFARASRRRGLPAAILGLACALWSSRPRTVRAFINRPAFRVRDTRQAGSVSSRAVW